VIAFVISFAMLAMFFFMALYMQNILGYSPLEAGIRFLPSTLVIMVTAPLAGRLTDRIGAKAPIAVGLTLVATALFLQSRITVDSGYAQLLPSFMLMGFGIGLTMSPMSTAAMNSVQEAKAGAAAGILSMSRMVGGTFGVAAVGALFQQLTDSRLTAKLEGLGLTAQQREWFADNLGSGDVNGKLEQLDPATAREVGRAMRETFVYALSSSMKLSTVVALVGVAAALVAVGGRPVRTTSAERSPRTAPAPAGCPPVSRAWSAFRGR
jgi:MFS family permease